MLLSISTTHRPATDLGYLLHKNPARVHSREQSYGTAHVFYSEATEERCTAVLAVEVDPVGLVRDRKGFATSGLLDQYVNDRPYAASSLLSAAISETLGSALNGRSADRPELAATSIPLEVEIPALPCRGGEGVLRSFFEPLGYFVQAERMPLDTRFPNWGESPYFTVKLATMATLQAVLSHLYVLIPVLDNAKHYWVGEDEVEKLLRHGEAWLSTHPGRDAIVRRYLKHRRSLADIAIARLISADDGIEEVVETPNAAEVLRGDAGEQALEKSVSLNERRLEAVVGEVEALHASSVIDFGCGEGKLLKKLIAMPGLRKVTGIDVSHRALEIATDRLNVERLPAAMREKLALLHGSLIYRDARFAGFDVAAVVEVIEHLDMQRLKAFERVLFEAARPRAIVMTTPNREYNALFPTLPAGQFRHADHRFEWTREEFAEWAQSRAERFGYHVRFAPVGDVHEQLGAPTQMAVFTLPG
jgi:3' terminal RNA ribose 2'-O-methyltransferase Hen1